jgi:hypothetical protein
MNDWGYMWTIARGNRCGMIFAEVVRDGRKWFEGKFRVLLREGSQDVATHDCNALDQCREIAEEFVQANVVYDTEEITNENK